MCINPVETALEIKEAWVVAEAWVVEGVLMVEEVRGAEEVQGVEESQVAKVWSQEVGAVVRHQSEVLQVYFARNSSSRQSIGVLQRPQGKILQKRRLLAIAVLELLCQAAT